MKRTLLTNRAITNLLAAAGLLLAASLPAQVKTQTDIQTGATTGTRTGIQSGAQTGIQNAAQSSAQKTAQPAMQPELQNQQMLDPLAPRHTLIPITVPTLSPGVIELMKLDGEFSEAVSKGGGKAFASWFADDAVTLNNGKPAVLGRTAITATAVWDPKTYQLSWFPEGAQMGPAGDTGFTWGHYDAKSTDQHGKPVTLSGRYITFWKKVDGKWKVALDASADEPPAAADCCKLPTP